MKKIITVVIFLFVAINISYAATSRSSYVVEVLVIQHKGKSAVEELWPINESKPILGLDKATSVKDKPPAYAKFNNAIERIAEDKRYKILAHKRWFQFAGTKSDARPVRIKGEENTEPVVDGTLKLYSKYYIYVDLHMQLREKMKKDVEKGDDASPVYILKEKRRVKLKQINYFDHPKFGLLVYVRPAR